MLILMKVMERARMKVMAIMLMGRMKVNLMFRCW